MVKFQWWILTTAATTGIGYYLGADFDAPHNDMLSWILLGVWIAFTLTFFGRIRMANQYNSPYNSFLFVFGALFFGVIFLIWGNYTIILTENLVLQYDFYLSIWMGILAMPFIFFGLIMLIFCFKRYFTVYVGQTPINARKFAFFNTFFIIGINLFMLFGQRGIISQWDSLFEAFALEPEPLQYLPDLVFWILIGFIGLIMIRYGIFGRRRSISSFATVTPREASRSRRTDLERSREQEQRRERELDQRRQQELARQNRMDSERQRERQREAELQRERERERQRQRNIERQRQMEADRKRRESQSRQPARVQMRATPQHISGGSSTHLEKMRPKAGTLSEEDFKCIFCFRLPKLPDDANRDIVLCPQCKHPAHADEFENWTRNSSLCSRCDGDIPSNFRSRPERIPVKTYLEAMRYHLKRK
jgi:hypothetical protein